MLGWIDPHGASCSCPLFQLLHICSTGYMYVVHSIGLLYTLENSQPAFDMSMCSNIFSRHWKPRIWCLLKDVLIIVKPNRHFGFYIKILHVVSTKTDLRHHSQHTWRAHEFKDRYLMHAHLGSINLYHWIFPCASMHTIAEACGKEACLAKKCMLEQFLKLERLYSESEILSTNCSAISVRSVKRKKKLYFCSVNSWGSEFRENILRKGNPGYTKKFSGPTYAYSRYMAQLFCSFTFQ